MSENLQASENTNDSSFDEESIENPSQDCPMSPQSSDEEDEELEEELMYYQIAMEAKAEIERIKTKVNDEFIFKKPLHPAPRAKNRSTVNKKTAVAPAVVPLYTKKVYKKPKYYYIETKYTPLPPLVPINREDNNPQISIANNNSILDTCPIPEFEHKPSKTFLFDPSRMPREEEDYNENYYNPYIPNAGNNSNMEEEDYREKYYNPYIPTAGNNSNTWMNSKSRKSDYELYGDPFGPGTSKAWTNWTEDNIAHNNVPPSVPSPNDEKFVSYGHYTQCLVEGCGCMFYYQAPDYSPKGGKKVFYIIESTDKNVNGKIMTLEEQRHYIYFHKDDFVSMKELEWEYEPNNIGNITEEETNASDYVEAVLGTVPNGSLYEPEELNDSLDREYYLFKYFEDIQSPSSSSDED